MRSITPYELLELISQNYSPAETIQIMNELICDIDNSPSKYINKLSQEVSDYSERYGLCPLCGSEIKTLEYQEDRGECRGFNSEETMYQYECSNEECSYTAE